MTWRFCGWARPAELLDLVGNGRLHGLEAGVAAVAIEQHVVVIVARLIRYTGSGTGPIR
jgi:hypothetical protein